jgi:hypothetical protein
MASKFFSQLLAYSLIASFISYDAFADSRNKRPSSTNQGSQNTSETATAFGLAALPCSEIQNYQRDNIRQRLLDVVSGYLTAVSTLNSYETSFRSTLFSPHDFQLIIKSGVYNRVRDRVFVLCTVMQDRPIAFAIQQSIGEEIAAAKELRQR